MFKAIILTIVVTVLHAVDTPPQWVLDGILATESSSTYNEDGTINYVNRAVGPSGELGPFQSTFNAWLQVRKRGERFAKLAKSTAYAEVVAIRYLSWLNKHYGHGNWDRVVEMYNAGPNNRSPDYLRKVKRHAGVQ